MATSADTLSENARPDRAWNDDLRQKVLAALAARKRSRHQAARAIDMDPSSFNLWLDGKTVAYPKTVQRLGSWLGASHEQVQIWKIGAIGHKRIHSGHGARSMLMTCAVCGASRIVRFAQLSARSQYLWTCSRTCGALVRLTPGPGAHAGNYAAFDAVKKCGSSQKFQREAGLTDREVRRLCTDPQYAPQAKTRGKLAAIPSIDWTNLFPTRAEDRWSENLERRVKRPKGSKKAKRIFGYRAGKARRASRIEKGGFPKLSEAQRQTALRKMQDPKYASALDDRLRIGRCSLRRYARSLQNLLRRHHPAWNSLEVYERTIERLRQSPYNIRDRFDAQILLMPRPRENRRGRKADVDYLRVHDLHLQGALWRDLAREFEKPKPENIRTDYLKWRRGLREQLKPAPPVPNSLSTK